MRCRVCLLRARRSVSGAVARLACALRSVRERGHHAACQRPDHSHTTSREVETYLVRFVSSLVRIGSCVTWLWVCAVDEKEKEADEAVKDRRMGWMFTAAGQRSRFPFFDRSSAKRDPAARTDHTTPLRDARTPLRSTRTPCLTCSPWPVALSSLQADGTKGSVPVNADSQWRRACWARKGGSGPARVSRAATETRSFLRDGQRDRGPATGPVLQRSPPGHSSPVLREE